MKRAWCSLVLVPGMLWIAQAGAHEVRPVALEVRQLEANVYTFEIRVPSTIAPDNRPELAWPADCMPASAGLMRCGQPMAGRSLDLRWPLFNPSVTTLARYIPSTGAVSTAVLPPDVSQWALPAVPTRWSVMRSYFVLGVGHILGGPDHLLFVAGLLLIAGSPRRILLAVTGFTLAHSMTLSLAALGLVHVPVPPTEAAIALSILFLAREALRPDTGSVACRFPLLVSALFGLLHGLGFAAALGEVGLPEREIVWALLFFNLGVEAGQLAFIFAIIAAVAAAMRIARNPARAQAWRPLARNAAAYGIGIPAAFWLVQRLL